MDIPDPEPPTLPAALPALFKSDDATYGPLVRIVPAPEAGYTLKAEVRDDKFDESKKVLSAKVWYFRFNSLPDSAKRACQDVKVMPGSVTAHLDWKFFERRAQQWQSFQLSFPKEPENGMESCWFINWVGSEITHNDWKASMANIQLCWHRVNKGAPRPRGVSERRAKQEASQAFSDHKTAYIQRLEACMVAGIPDSGAFRIVKAKKEASRRNRQERVQARIAEVRDYDPYPETLEFQALDGIPEDIRSYEQFSAREKLEFFNNAATKNIFASFYAPLADAISVASNLEDEYMQRLMIDTVVYTAKSAEFHYLRPHRQNERFARKNPTLKNPSPQPLLPDRVRDTFKTIQQRRLKDIPDFPKSIEKVLVPNAGVSQQTKKAGRSQQMKKQTKKRSREQPEDEEPWPEMDEEDYKRARV